MIKIDPIKRILSLSTPFVRIAVMLLINVAYAYAFFNALQPLLHLGMYHHQMLQTDSVSLITPTYNIANLQALFS